MTSGCSSELATQIPLPFDLFLGSAGQMTLSGVCSGMSNSKKDISCTGSLLTTFFGMSYHSLDRCALIPDLSSFEARVDEVVPDPDNDIDTESRVSFTVEKLKYDIPSFLSAVSSPSGGAATSLASCVGQCQRARLSFKHP
jgi:hypothetical protein